MEKKVLMILSKEFINDPRVNKEAISLVKKGFNVSVLSWDRHGSFLSEEEVNKINIIRLKNSWFMRRLPHDLLRNPFWWWHAYKKALSLYRKGFTFEIVHCHDLDTLAAGMLLKRKLGVKLVYDAHEIFGFMIARDMPSLVVKIAFLMEKLLTLNVDWIITVNNPLKKYFQSIAKHKPISIVMNCKDLIIDKYTSPNNDCFTLCYIGILHKNRMFPEIIDIIGSLKDIKFIIAGQKEGLYDIVKDRSKDYSNIHFLGTIPFKEVIPTTLQSDVVICMINPEDPNNKIALANKQFEAMVCGRPIITTKGTYVGELTRKLDCGLVIEYNQEHLKKAILDLKNNKELCEKLGKNALNAAKEKYNWSTQIDNLIELYNTLCIN